MNKIKWIFIVTFMFGIISFNCTSAMAEETGVGTEIDTSVFEYRENEDGTIYISNYNGTEETVIIPSEIDGKTVMGIGVSSFSQCNTMKYLIISEGITDVLDNGFDGTFYSCKNLESVSLPSTLKTIGKSAFSGCIKLSEINLPEGLVSIGDYAFYECVKLNNVVLPDGLINIGCSAFCNCHSIEKLTVPDSVTKIGEDAFLKSGFKYMIIYGNPDAYIKTYADTNPNIKFSCINHPNIVIDPAVTPNCKEPGRTQGSHCTVCGTYIVKPQRIDPNGQHIWNDGMIKRNPTAKRNGEKIYKCIDCGEIRIETIAALRKGSSIADSNASYKVTNLSTKENTVEFTAMQKSETNVIIPNTVKIDGIIYKVTSIAKNAFKNNKNLKKITIGGNITKINANAFRGCANLKIIKVKSKKLKSVGKNAFKGISPKAKIKVPSNCLEKYKKMLTKKGQKSSVKITK